MYHTPRGERRYRTMVARGGEVWRFYQVVRDGDRWRRVFGPEIPTHRLFVNAAGVRRAYEFPPSFPVDDRWKLYPDKLVEGQLEASTPT